MPVRVETLDETPHIAGSSHGFQVIAGDAWASLVTVHLEEVQGGEVSGGEGAIEVPRRHSEGLGERHLA
jgi:hypothetical protein